ncbi:hypothetical protein INR49_017505, partial [Caranx melampygus]
RIRLRLLKVTLISVSSHERAPWGEKQEAVVDLRAGTTEPKHRDDVRSSSDHDKQQISEISIPPASPDAKQEPFMPITRAAHSLQSSQVPQIHLFLT